MTEVRAASENNPWSVQNAGQHKFQNSLSDKDLRRFTLVLGFYPFSPWNQWNPWLMKNAGSYNFQKLLSDKDLRGFTLVLGLCCFNPCSSVESAVNDLFDNCRESSTNRPYFFQNKPNFRKG
jgi:hypothetical protein